MEVTNIIKEIDAQIAKLRQARVLLADTEAAPKHRGRQREARMLRQRRKTLPTSAH